MRMNGLEGNARTEGGSKGMVVIFVAGRNHISPEVEKCDLLTAVLETDQSEAREQMHGK